MNDKRSDFPCPMIIGKRPSIHTERAHLVHEQSQKSYREDRHKREAIIELGHSGAFDPPEGVGKGSVRPGGRKTR